MNLRQRVEGLERGSTARREPIEIFRVFVDGIEGKPGRVSRPYSRAEIRANPGFEIEWATP